MKKKSPEEMERAKVAKATRALIRLKHSLAADEEVNAVLPDTLAEFDMAVSKRELKGLRASLDDVFGGDGAPGA